jgi:hypothetical protein
MRPYFDPTLSKNFALRKFIPHRRKTAQSSPRGAPKYKIFQWDNLAQVLPRQLRWDPALREYLAQPERNT